MSGFLGGIQIDPDEANALISGDGDAQKAESLRAYVRSLRAMMGVGVPPLPGTHLSPEVAIPGGYPARWLVPRAVVLSVRGPRARVVAWIHGGAFLFCGGTTTPRGLILRRFGRGRARLLRGYAAPSRARRRPMLGRVTRTRGWSREGGGGVDLATSSSAATPRAATSRWARARDRAETR